MCATQTRSGIMPGPACCDLSGQASPAARAGAGAALRTGARAQMIRIEWLRDRCAAGARLLGPVGVACCAGVGISSGDDDEPVSVIEPPTASEGLSRAAPSVKIDVSLSAKAARNVSDWNPPAAHPRAGGARAACITRRYGDGGRHESCFALRWGRGPLASSDGRASPRDLCIPDAGPGYCGRGGLRVRNACRRGRCGVAPAAFVNCAWPTGLVGGRTAFSMGIEPIDGALRAPGRLNGRDRFSDRR
jgi:hypothetical protein